MPCLRYLPLWDSKENIYRMKPVKTTKVKSISNPNTIHLIHEFQDGLVICTCEGFENRKNCKHLTTKTNESRPN